MFDTEEKRIRCLLVSVDTGEFDAKAGLEELAELCETAHLEVVASALQAREKPDTATCVGQGKLEEIDQIAKANEVDLLVFDRELTAVQLRNIEAQTGLAVLDRTMLILDIFAMRAKTAEGKLQVELAQQKYRLPRLMGMGTALSRLGGGQGGAGVGTRGPGETKLETDRRTIRRRVWLLEEQLKELTRKREVARQSRKKNQTPVISIAGYTNAGKSTLLNYLTGAGILSADMLFATLDPTARGLTLPNGMNTVLVDTVGFITRLPHQLIQAFHSTLEEVSQGDLILLVVDASDEDWEQKADVSRELLTQLGCEADRIITVFNKIDRLETSALPHTDGETAIGISALTGQGVDELLHLLAKRLENGFARMRLLIPYDKAGLLAKVRENGKVYDEAYQADGILADCLVEAKLQKLLLTFLTDTPAS